MMSNLRSARRRLPPAGRAGRVEVAERLVEVDRQAEVGAAGRAARPDMRGGHQVGLEDLDAVEAAAAAAAVSLSSSVPEMQTVASAVRRPPRRPAIRTWSTSVLASACVAPPADGTRRHEFPSSGWTRGRAENFGMDDETAALDAAVAGLLSAEGWPTRRRCRRGRRPGRFHALFGRDSLIFAWRFDIAAAMGAGCLAGPNRRPGDDGSRGRSCTSGDLARRAGWSRRLAGARGALRYHGTWTPPPGPDPAATGTPRCRRSWPRR